MAGSRTYRTHALVLDKTKLGEADLIYTLLAEDGREIRAVGKGARKPGNRLAARCELCCNVDLLLARGKSLDIISEATLIEAPLGPTPSFELLTAASAVAEVARFCCYEDAEDRFVYPITAKAFGVMGCFGAGALDGAHLDLMVAAYVFKILSHLGYRPDYSGCVACGDEAVSYFSAMAGGFLCASCASTVPGAEQIDANIAGWLRSLIAMRFDELVRADIDASTATFLVALSHSWAATHLDARLRSLEFLLGC